MVRNDNPAGRLYYILFEAKGQNNQLQVKKVWANLFGIEDDNSIEIFEIISLLNKLLAEVKRSIADIEGINKELFLVNFDKISRVLTLTNLEINWANIVHNLDDATLLNLAFCSEALSSIKAESLIENTELQELQELVESLSHAVISTSINKDLKNFILSQLEFIRKAILSYRIQGVDGLKKALEHNIGALVINKDISTKPQNKDILEKYSKILEKLEKVINLASKTKQLIFPVFEKILHLLPQG